MSEIKSNELNNSNYKIQIGKIEFTAAHIFYWFFAYVSIKYLGLKIYDICNFIYFSSGSFFSRLLAALVMPEELLIAAASAILAVCLYPVVVKGKPANSFLHKFAKVYLLVITIFLSFSVFNEIHFLAHKEIFELQNFVIDNYILMIILVISMSTYSRNKFLNVDFNNSWYAAILVLILYVVFFSIRLNKILSHRFTPDSIVIGLHIGFMALIVLYIINVFRFKKRTIKPVASIIAKVFILSMMILNVINTAVRFYYTLSSWSYGTVLENIKYVFHDILEYKPHYFIALLLFVLLYIQADKKEINKTS